LGFSLTALKPCQPVGRAIAAVLKQGDYARVETTGHTDAMGSDVYNQGLSERRSFSVRLPVGNGIAAERLRASGRGESVPVAGNDTDEGRAMNRRVELVAHPQ
jgi:outer membrane protein OmpA-like peptidoglycan-associated protein